MVYLTDIQGYFADWYSYLINFWERLIEPNFTDTMTYYSDQLYEALGVLSFPLTWTTYVLQALYDFVFPDASLLQILLGQALIIFVVYTFFKWLLDIIF